jgi:quercetin dioxygenase-like cupin family protein
LKYQSEVASAYAEAENRERNTLRAGQVFWRPARETHNVKNPGDRTARVLAVDFDPAA